MKGQEPQACTTKVFSSVLSFLAVSILLLKMCFAVVLFLLLNWSTWTYFCYVNLDIFIIDHCADYIVDHLENSCKSQFPVVHSDDILVLFL